MYKRLFHLVAILLLTCLSAAGQQLSVYTADGQDVYEARHAGDIRCTPDSFQIGVEPAYCFHDVDSITVSSTSASGRPRGWWGDPVDGPLCYYTQIAYINSVYDVCFTVTLADGVCLSVTCQSELISGPPYENDATSYDPYIFVKSTTTGPRMYEEWEMGFAHIVPKQVTMTSRGQVKTGDCTPLLTGRNVDEVMRIIEAWIYQTAIRVEKEKESQP